MSQSKILASESPSELLSERIIRAVADAEGVSPTALDTPLYESIDPEALDRLFRSSDNRHGMTVSAQFEYYGYKLDIHSDGQLTLTEL